MAFGIKNTVTVAGGRLQSIKQIDTVGKVGEISRVKDVSIKAFPCPKVNDKGLTGAWWWADKIAIAVSVWATYETWKAAKEEYKIGKRYYNLAKEQWDHFYQYYRPLEDQELDEIWAENTYSPDYPTAVSGHTRLINAVFDKSDKHRAALSNKYCVCYDPAQFTKTELVKSTVYGDSNNFARRYAEKLAQEKNDIRWARRIAAASRGRGLLSASTAFASKASGFYSDYAQAMGGLASNAAQFSGYIRNRHQTEYNPVRERIDGRADVPDTYRGFDAAGYWGNRGIPTTVSSGGLSWSNYETTPYTPSGFDPTGVVQPSTRM